MYPEAQKTASGLRYIIEDMGSGEKPALGQVVRVNYAGFLWMANALIPLIRV